MESGRSLIEGGASSDGSPAAHGQGRFSTRRRLIAAFAAVLVATLSPLAVQLAGLRRMDATFDAMKHHEEQIFLALQLENAVREQYGHQAHFVFGESGRLHDYENTRALAVELARTLSDVIDEPDAMEWMEEIHAANAELDRLFRERVEPAVRARDPVAVRTHELSYAHVALIDRNVDRIIGCLQEATSSFRKQLVDLQQTARRWTAILLVGIPAFVAAAVLYLSRSVAKPLAQLSEGAAAIAAGDLGTRIDIHTPDEFGALAGKLNAMTVSLKQHQERLVESEKLAGIGRLAAGVAHELNNPLQVILGYLSLNRDVPDRRLAAQLAATEDEARRCKEIVENLLELSRPATSITLAPVDLRTLCEEVFEGIQVSAQQGGVRFSVEGAAVAPADRPKLRQILVNLVKNAAEAAGPGGDVRVRIGRSGERVELAVADTGPGIGPEARARMFEPFFTTKPNGTGLGLAVSRAIARAHGGDIDVGNGESGGAVFTLRLPRSSEGRR